MIEFLQEYGLFVGGAVALLILISNGLGNTDWLSPKPKVRSKTFLTKTEREALRHIEAALPWCRIHAQVAMGALVQPLSNLSRSNFQRERVKFSQKIVDFVAEDRSSGKIIFLIELDDRTHDVCRDAKRDRITAVAGYRTIRLRLKWPTERSVAEAIGKAMAELG